MLSEETYAAVFHGAWPDAYNEVGALVQSFAAPSSPTPAEAARGKESEVRDIQRALVDFIAAAGLRYHLAINAGLRMGVIVPDIAARIDAQARDFTGAVASERRAYCPFDSCTWRGDVADAGPAGQCPTCERRPVKLAPVLVSAAGAGAVSGPGAGFSRQASRN